MAPRLRSGLSDALDQRTAAARLAHEGDCRTPDVSVCHRDRESSQVPIRGEREPLGARDQERTGDWDRDDVTSGSPHPREDAIRYVGH